MDNKILTTLKIEKISPYVLLITLNREEVRNAINSVMMRELYQFWSEINVKYQGIRCIILTGAGNKAFCSGADLKERKDLSLENWKSQHLVLQQAMLSMVQCPVPIIAAVNGAAFGGGLELALAADFIYAANTATFSQSEVKLGIMPGAMGTQHLSGACGLRRAKELSYTGTIFSAEQAQQWGLINTVCTLEQLLNTVMAVAEQIANNAPYAVRQVKKAISASSHLDIHSGYALELGCYQGLLPTKDRVEGIRAFNEKRKPVFHDE